MGRKSKNEQEITFVISFIVTILGAIASLICWIFRAISKLFNTKSVKNENAKTSNTLIPYKKELKNDNKTVPVIDVTEESDRIKNSLLADWDKNFNYPELNEFENSKQIIEFILDNWSLVNLDRILMKKLYGEQFYKISNYKEIQEKLDYICLREKSRIMHLIHREKYIKSNFIWCKLATNDPQDELNNTLCLLQDVDKLPRLKQRSNGKWFIRFNFIPTYDTDKSKRKVKFYHNGEFHKMYKKDFELYCEKNNLMFPSFRNFLD